MKIKMEDNESVVSEADIFIFQFDESPEAGSTDFTFTN